MSWLARLKKLQGTEIDPTETTKNISVVSVVYPQAPIEISCHEFDSLRPVSANDSVMQTKSCNNLLTLFMQRGLNESQATMLHDKLTIRDLRGDDDRRVCLECLHLSGTVTGRKCGKWRKLNNRNSAAVIDTLDVLQRCPEFDPVRHDWRMNYA